MSVLDNYSLIKDIKSGYVLFIQVETPNEYYSTKLLSNDNAGYDILTAETWISNMDEKAHLLDLGVRAMMVDIQTKQPVHYWLLPRSSIYKTGHMMANSVGIIDSSYRGVLKAPVIRTIRQFPDGFMTGERHFQIVAPDMGHICAVIQVDELPSTVRGECGFGSTGK